MNRSTVFLPSVCLGLFIGCGPAPTPAKPNIRIGVIYSLTGSGGTAGTNQLDSAVLAAEEINKAGGVLGAKLELLVRDDATDLMKAVEVANELVLDAGVQVIIGPNTSPTALTIANNVTIANKRVHISSAATSPAFTTIVDDGYFFRTAPSDVFQFRLQAQRAYDKGFRKVAIIHPPGTTGVQGSAAFETAFKAKGGTITGKYEYVEKQTSYTALLTTVYATETPDAITLLGLVNEGAQIIKDYNAGFSAKATFWFFANSHNADFVTGVGGSNFTFAHEGTRPTVAAKNDRFPHFKTVFNARYSKDPSNFGQSNAFDAVHLVALAIEAAGSYESLKIRDQMTAVSSGGTAFSAVQMKDALAAAKKGDDINYQGASGDVDFDANGDVLSGYDIWKVMGGTQTNVETDLAPPP